MIKNFFKKIIKAEQLSNPIYFNHNYKYIENTYLNYVNNTKKDGNIIINTDDVFMQNWVKKLNRKFYTYGIDKDNQNLIDSVSKNQLTFIESDTGTGKSKFVPNCK